MHCVLIVLPCGVPLGISPCHFGVIGRGAWKNPVGHLGTQFPKSSLFSASVTSWTFIYYLSHLLDLQKDVLFSLFLSTYVIQCKGSVGDFKGPSTEARPATTLSQVGILLGDGFFQSPSVTELHTAEFLTQATLL